MFENLQSKLDKAFRVLKGQGRVTEINVAETLKEVRRALLEADVNFKIAKDFVSEVKEKAIGQKIISSINPSQMMVKIVHDELKELMGGNQVGLDLSKELPVILVAGLQGSGKTTFSAKLARFLKQKKKKNPLLIAADVYRPAAVEQLKILGSQIDTSVFSIEGSKNPLEIIKKGIAQAKEEKNNVVIIDTAGRLAVDEQMMSEIKQIHQSVAPSETLFVVDAMTGQDAVNTAQAFNEALDFDGVVLTKLDGDTRGGSALTIRKIVGKPIKFISSGEKMETLDLFYPDRMASRILGMGDIVSLVEKAQEQFDEAQVLKIHKKIVKNRFDLEDFLAQIGQVKKMGDMKSLLAMVPGMGKISKQVDIKQDAFKHTEAIIYSMTPYERRTPTSIDASRKKRIAKGSGTSVEKVNALLKQFSEIGKMLKQAGTPFGRQMLKNMTSRMGLGKE